MKKTYIIPTTRVHVVNITHHILSASETPSVSLGSGKTGDFDAKEDNLWDEWDD